VDGDELRYHEQRSLAPGSNDAGGDASRSTPPALRADPLAIADHDLNYRRFFAVNSLPRRAPKAWALQAAGESRGRRSWLHRRRR
jgi:hypothetical protein